MQIGIIKYFQILIASMFLILVGISLIISRKKHFKDYFISGLKIFSFAMIISIVTYYLFLNSYIRFGILHIIGISIILSYIFRNFKIINLIFGTIFILIGIVFSELNNNFFQFLGLYSTEYISIDYYPIFPWFGLILIGMYIGNKLYANNQRNFRIIKQVKYFKFISYLGKYSLFIYLTHQIILFGIFYILKI